RPGTASRAESAGPGWRRRPARCRPAGCPPRRRRRRPPWPAGHSRTAGRPAARRNCPGRGTAAPRHRWPAAGCSRTARSGPADTADTPAPLTAAPRQAAGNAPPRGRRRPVRWPCSSPGRRAAAHRRPSSVTEGLVHLGGRRLGGFVDALLAGGDLLDRGRQDALRVDLRPRRGGRHELRARLDRGDERLERLVRGHQLRLDIAERRQRAHRVVHLLLVLLAGQQLANSTASPYFLLARKTPMRLPPANGGAIEPVSVPGSGTTLYLPFTAPASIAGRLKSPPMTMPAFPAANAATASLPVICAHADGGQMSSEISSA